MVDGAEGWAFGASADCHRLSREHTARPLRLGSEACDVSHEGLKQLYNPRPGIGERSQAVALMFVGIRRPWDSTAAVLAKVGRCWWSRSEILRRTAVMKLLFGPVVRQWWSWAIDLVDYILLVITDWTGIRE